jgi:hypothetical protein
VVHIAWSVPLTAVTNTALTAAQWNSSVRDNLLTTAPALATTAGSIFAATGTNAIAQRTPATAANNTPGTTTSTTYTATLTGSSSASVTVTTGPKALVAFSCRQSTSTSTVNVWTSVAVSGTSTIAAADTWALSMDILGQQIYHGLTYLETSLTAGSSNTFTLQHRISSAGTYTVGTQRLSVVPF